MTTMAPEYSSLCLIQKVEVFEYALSMTTGQDLAKVLWLKSPNAEVWLDRRTAFTRSLAVMSMVGYILGLGDRHTCNLMLDRDSGEIVHIDFGDCFEVATHRDKYPERVPFRLTRMLVAAMEVSGIEGSYRSVCERVMRVMRKNKNSVMALLEAFIYDPLISWRLLDTNKVQQHRSPNQEAVNWRLTEGKRGGRAGVGGAGGSGSGSGSAGGGVGSGKGLPPPPLLQVPASPHTPPHSPPSDVDGLAPPLLPMTALDRRRSIVEEEKKLSDASTEQVSEKALAVVARVESKLKGTDFVDEVVAAGGGVGVGGEVVLDVERQVQRLIMEATSHINLCQAYIGWCAFW